MGGGKETQKRGDYEMRRAEVNNDAPDIATLLQHFKEDRTFLTNTLDKGVKAYQKRAKVEGTPTEILKSLKWNIVELVDLLDHNQKCLSASGKASQQRCMPPCGQTYSSI